jgi:DNA-binding transcriptional MerR regulator
MPRTRHSRETRPTDSGGTRATIPDKLYFRIGEVGKLTETEPYVLRYWETEFPTLRPMKSRSGHRLYRRQDIEMVLEIRRLLYKEGFTIEGARRQFPGNSKRPRDSKRGQAGGAPLKAIKRELQSILTMLSDK